ncbi:MAG: response regulator transcription factor [Clostridiales bacterium]|jgi:two-component system response regulator VicR|nr:response regulator transcription factor [Clostridiales bacterium]
MNSKILVVDDEKSIVDIISYNLKKEGYEVITAYDGQQGLKIAMAEAPDLILLDIMMPKLDGFEVCRRIRDKKLQTPVIMLTARAEEVDKVLGFELGADDYVTKPFGVRELMARVKANLRKRAEPEPIEEPKSAFVVSDLVFDMNMQDIKRNGRVIALTPREFELTRFLATQKNQVFTREDLLEKVWKYEYFGDVRTVDVTIRRLRSKLEENPEKPRYIITKRGVGYYFDGTETT